MKAAGFAFLWLLVLFAAAVSVYGMAGNGKMMAEEMLRRAPPAGTGLPEEEYPGVGRMIADYLTDREPDFRYSFSDAAGNTYICFQQHEADHMADCRALIRLAGTLRWITGGIILILAGICIPRRQARKAFAQGMLRGLAAAAGIGLMILAWALIDFDGLFTAFHRLAFTNEGWLLDTRTDLLIRLMPTSFFTALGARWILWTAAAAAAAGLAAWAVTRQKEAGPDPQNGL